MILFYWPTQEGLAIQLAKKSGALLGEYLCHTFPDQESKITVKSEVKEKHVFILCSLDQPNQKIMPLILLAQACRDQGARSVTLIAPYLAYMRQDIAFHPGEAVSAVIFARVLSQHFDKVITVDPHCHRIADLSSIFSIPVKVLTAESLILRYIQSHIHNPLIIGPDSESEQWVAGLARQLQAPLVVLSKVRHADHQVSIELPTLQAYTGKTPVLVDDIISTGMTLITVVEQLKQYPLVAPYCVAVHGLFTQSAFSLLMASGVKAIVTTNSITSHTNELDLAELIAPEMRL